MKTVPHIIVMQQIQNRTDSIVYEQVALLVLQLLNKVRYFVYHAVKKMCYKVAYKTQIVL